MSEFLHLILLLPHPQRNICRVPNGVWQSVLLDNNPKVYDMFLCAGFLTIIIGIFLLHAFKDINVTLADLPKFSRSGVEATAQYSRRLLEDPENGTQFMDSDDEDSAVLFAKTKSPNGLIPG